MPARFDPTDRSKEKTFVEFSTLNTDALQPLINEKNEEIKEKAILKCSERLKGERGAGRGNTKNLTSGDVRKIIRSVIDASPGV